MRLKNSSYSNANEAAVNVAVPVAGNPTCTIAGPAATSCTDAVTSVAVAAGDLVSIRVVPSATAPTGRAMRWSAKFSATP